jgi:hypothetical protein
MFGQAHAGLGWPDPVSRVRRAEGLAGRRGGAAAGGRRPGRAAGRLIEPGAGVHARGA